MAEAAVPSSSSDAPVSRQPHLSKQDLSTLNPAELTPLSPMVISRQATINIGDIEHASAAQHLEYEHSSCY